MKNTENQEVEPTTSDFAMPETDTVAAETTDNETDTDKMAVELQEWKDKYIRLTAEFDNFRKRTLKEKMELIENGGADVLKAVLGTADDFERALTAMKDSPDAEGVRLIYRKFMDTLKSKGVTEIPAIGRVLDVDFHDAVAKIPSAEVAHNTVIDVVQKGYMLKDKVLRFAKAVVSE